jgi:type I restriction-modification system DNA methylase subunit
VAVHIKYYSDFGDIYAGRAAVECSIYKSGIAMYGNKMASEGKQRGQTYTPQTVSRALTRWAIQSADDTVLEPSVGEGRFVFDAHDTLTSLGASDDEAREAIYRLDIDEDAVAALQEQAKGERGGEYPNVDVGNLF